jgi:hypothetical protein
MTTYKWLVVNEVNNIPTAEWEVIQQFLLDVGAHKPEVPKHSRAYGGTREILDISLLSLSLMYNDITDYPVPDEYFDSVTKRAVKDRFPALRFWGVLQEDFNQLKAVDISSFVKANFDKYKTLIYNIAYYREHLLDETKKYKESPMLSDIPERWKINLGRLFKLCAAYSLTQDEYDTIVQQIYNCVNDYAAMLHYPKAQEIMTKRVSGKDLEKLQEDLNTESTFIIKNQLIEKQINKKGNKGVSPSKFW